MCLAKLSPKKPANRGFGYKVFIPDTSKTVICSCQRDVLPKNRWVSAERRPLGTDAGEGEVPYPSGFHVYKRLADARDYQFRWSREVIYRVEYRGAHTQGTQYPDRECPVVVADQIRVLRKVASK